MQGQKSANKILSAAKNGSIINLKNTTNNKSKVLFESTKNF